MCSSIVSSDRRLFVRARRGISVIFTVIILVVLIAFVSFAVDVGRVRLALAELQTVADAAARNGAYSLPKIDGTGTPVRTTQYVIDATLDSAARNPVIDNDDTHNYRTDPGMQLDAAEDIHFGVWDKVNRTFTEIIDQPGTQQDERRLANAVRANARRLEKRDNPVKLVFAPIVGRFTKDVEQKATAYVEGESSKEYGFIGIQGVSAVGNGARINGGVMSDGNISLGNADINGDARPGIGGDITQGPNSVVTGWMADLTFTVAPLFPPKTTADIPQSATKFPTGSNITLNGGTTFSTSLKYRGTWDNNVRRVTINPGYVVLFIEDVSGKTKGVLDLTTVDFRFLNPSTIDPAKTPSRLEIYIVGTKVKTVDTNGNRQCYMHVYAPQCDVRLTGTADFYGWAIGKTLNWNGTASYNYDHTLGIQPVSPVKVHLVE